MLNFFRTRYVASLEQRIEELKAEKLALQQRIRDLEGCIIPSLRAIEREKAQSQPGAVVPMNRHEMKAKIAETTGDEAKVERMPPAKSWIQVRGQLEELSAKG